MSIKERYQVQPIKRYECREWLLEKHYARRLPSISYAFGLYGGRDLVGILTIGKPAANGICVGSCGKPYAGYVYELNRLCVSEGLEKNVLSFFVGQSFKLITDDLIVVSYADTSLGHHGYIYQATNWVYTGLSAIRTDPKGRPNQHSRHIKCEAGLERVIRPRKHRYFYFIGKRAKEFRRSLIYPVLPYPKGDNQRYDASYEPVTQALLF